MKTEEIAISKMEETLKIAADKTRLKILFTLLCGLDCDEEVEKCVNDIAIQVGCSQSLVSHQLKVLKDGHFVKSRKEGTRIYYSLKDAHVREIIKITYEHVTEEEHE